MAGVYQLEISESEVQLKQLLRQQKTASAKERVQLLYLLKSEQAETVQAAAELLGRHRVTAQEWLRRYREGGLAGMLQTQARSGRPRAIPAWAEAALQKRLEAPEGFDGYQAICDWLETQLGLEVKYKTVHKLVHERLQAAPKVPRPLSVEQSSEQKEAYKKNLSEHLAMLGWVALTILGWSGSIRFFCGDETRLGLKTLGGRKITARGIKPVGQVQWQFEATYLYGIVEPKTGASFFFEFSHLNTDCFQAFLDLVSEEFKNEILIVQLDNGAFHKAKRLKVPANIVLFFQPPHCPELNPIEQVWQYLKRRLRWRLPATLDQSRQQLKERLERLTPEVVASITGRDLILPALSVAGI